MTQNTATSEDSSAVAAARRPRRFLLRVAMVLLGIVGGWLALEAGLRVLGGSPVPISKRYLIAVGHEPRLDYHCYASNPNGEFSPPPDLSQGRWRLINFAKQEFPLEAIRETPWVVEYQYSEQGTRDRAYHGPPADGVLRIGGLGASFAFGEGVPIEKSLFRQIEARAGQDCEVVNSAAPGMKTAQMVELLPQLVEQIGCRRAIVVFTPSDILLNEELQAQQNVINDLVNTRDLALSGHLQGKWYGHSRVISTLMLPSEMREVEARTKQWYLDGYDPEKNGANLERMRASLAALGARSDCRTVLVMYPLLIDLEGEYPLASIHERIGKMAEEAGLPTLDLAETFQGRKTSSLWVHPSDHHPNGQAHALAAEAIVNWLRKSVPGYLP